MPAPFDLNDDSVVVVVGSGAGGGTLSNELAQKGVKVVCLEAGGRHEMQDFENDEWPMFSKISWLDKRTTSGTWRVAKDFSGLPAWIVKAVGGSTVHWAGASLRFQEHEFKAKSTYGDTPGAALLDWPITLAEMEPWYDKAEDKMGTTRTHGIPGLPGSNNFKVLEAGAKKLGYKEVHTGRMSINSEPRKGRGSCLQIGFCFQSAKPPMSPPKSQRSPRDGVVNKHGQSHDIANLFVSDGSQFTTGGAENPTLTIVALAIRQADFIAGEMSKGNL